MVDSSFLSLRHLHLLTANPFPKALPPIVSEDINPVTNKDTNMKILATNKAIRNYLKSQTSTIKGIKKVETTTKNTIKNVVSDFDTEELSDKDINELYKYLSDPDFNYATQYFDPSDLWINLAEIKSAGGNEEDFLRRIENYLSSDSLYKDDDLVESLTNIYNKFNR